MKGGDELLSLLKLVVCLPLLAAPDMVRSISGVHPQWDQKAQLCGFAEEGQQAVGVKRGIIGFRSAAP